MKYPTDFWAFVIETYKRMSLKSPRFFQIIQAIGMIAALGTGIPLALQQANHLLGFDIPLPEVVNSYITRIVFWCGIVTKGIAKLPVTDPNAPVNAQGRKVSPTKAIPFTTKKQS